MCYFILWGRVVESGKEHIHLNHKLLKLVSIHWRIQMQSGLKRSLEITSSSVKADGRAWTFVDCE